MRQTIETALRQPEAGQKKRLAGMKKILQKQDQVRVLKPAKILLQSERLHQRYK